MIIIIANIGISVQYYCKFKEQWMGGGGRAECILPWNRKMITSYVVLPVLILNLSLAPTTFTLHFVVENIYNSRHFYFAIGTKKLTILLFRLALNVNFLLKVENLRKNPFVHFAAQGDKYFDQQSCFPWKICWCYTAASYPAGITHRISQFGF